MQKQRIEENEEVRFKKELTGIGGRERNPKILL
jgi:hypothetical protein